MVQLLAMPHPEDSSKDQAAVALGRKGGLKGLWEIGDIVDVLEAWEAV